MKLSDIQFHREKTTATKLRRVYAVMVFEDWLKTPKYVTYAHCEKPHKWWFRARGKAMVALKMRLGI